MEAIFPEVRGPEREANYSNNVMWRLDVKRATPPFPQYVLMACLKTNVLCLKKPVISNLTDIFWFFILHIQHHWISNVKLSYFIEMIYIYITTVVTVLVYYTVTLLYWDRDKWVPVTMPWCFSGCGWTMAFNMEGSCEYIE